MFRACVFSALALPAPPRRRLAATRFRREDLLAPVFTTHSLALHRNHRYRYGGGAEEPSVAADHEELYKRIGLGA